jgi:hypothetical protein
MPIELTFLAYDHHEPDGWSQSGQVITETISLNRVREALSQGKILLVKHWHYRGSRCPDHVAIEDFDDFVEYLRSSAVAGDAIDVYDITHAITDAQRVAHGKCPNEKGEVPERGAY